MSDCSCSDISASSASSNNSHSSDGSVETIVDAQERAVKHSDIYIINGSEVSKASSKASHKSKMSKKSSNYDPLPVNGIDKVRQRKLTEEEIEQERCDEENQRRFNSTTERISSKERSKPKPRSVDNVKGSVKSKVRLTNQSSVFVNIDQSQGSWTNEEFAKLYEPVSADELKRKKQMRDLKQQLKVKLTNHRSQLSINNN